jgi:PAS domain-containing protein
VTRSEPAGAPPADLPPGEGSTRRRLLVAGLSSALLAVAGGRAASATTPPTDAPAPAADDRDRLAFAQGLELAARDLYEAAIDAGADPAVLATLAYNHQAYGHAIAGATGLSADRRDDAFYASLEGDFASADTAAVALAGYDLESALVATHTELLVQLADQNAAKVVASVIATEARHCTVLASLGGQGGDLDALLVNEAEPITPGSSTT